MQLILIIRVINWIYKLSCFLIATGSKGFFVLLGRIGLSYWSFFTNVIWGIFIDNSFICYFLFTQGF